jgi:hypothetical protein
MKNRGDRIKKESRMREGGGVSYPGYFAKCAEGIGNKGVRRDTGGRRDDVSEGIRCGTHGKG